MRNNQPLFSFKINNPFC